MQWNEMTWEEINALVPTDPVVIIPLGSTEQHGPHLPVKTDIAIADYLAREVGERTGSLVTPPLNFGYSSLWHRFPGTISLSSDVFCSTVEDMCRSVILSGFRRLFLLNGHGPNNPMIQKVTYDLVDQYEDLGISIAAGTYLSMGTQDVNSAELALHDGGHANYFETALMMYLFPEQIDPEKVKLASEDYCMRKCTPTEQGALVVNAWPQSEGFRGVYGKPDLATFENGEKLMKAYIEDLSEFVLTFKTGKYDPVGKDGHPQKRTWQTPSYE